MFDVLSLLYSTSHWDASILEIIPVNSMDLTWTLLGGINAGKYVINAMPEQLGNYQASRRISTYCYRDLTASSTYTSTASGSLTVRDGSSRFKVGDTIAIYAGGFSLSSFDLGDIYSITGNVLNFITSYSSDNTYPIGTSVLVLRHQGQLDAIDTSDNLIGHQSISTTSFFNQFGNILVNENVRSTGTINFEAGWCLWNIITTVGASAFPDLVLKQSNFLMTTSVSGALDGGGNGNSNVGYSGTNTSTPCMSFFQDIISQANGGSTVSPPPQFTIDIDCHNVVRFHIINQTTPDVFLYTNSYTNDGLGDGLFADCVINNTTHIQDLTNVKNVINGVGGTDALGNAITVTVVDQISVNTYGQRETLLTNANANSSDSLKNWCTGQLNLVAYPLTTFSITIFPTRSIIDTTNYVQVGLNPSLPSL